MKEHTTVRKLLAPGMLAALATLMILAAACSGTKSTTKQSTDDGSGAAVEPTRYELYLERIENGDTAIDFADFRMAFSESPLYDPYGSDKLTGKDEDGLSLVRSALNDSNFSKAAEILEGLLAHSYVNISAHLYAIAAYEGLGDVTKANHHRSMYRGLVKSIFASGDGETPETAFVVISTDETYYILHLLELQTVQQALVPHGGSNYDLMTAKDRNTGETVELYFNVDRQFAYLNNMFNKPDKTEK